jgi:2-polyprenyl-6-methoxyphenol hydroxylase-like FAD-dependent oxidoreductase
VLKAGAPRSEGSPVEELPVLVVGAGPVGLALAVILEHHGVRCRIVDRADTPAGLSKAAAIQSRTLEILDELRLAGPILDVGTRITASEIRSRDDVVAAFGAGGIAMESRYPFLLGIAQSDTETLLTHRLAERGIAVERGIELGECRQDERGVTALLRSPDGSTEVVRSRWLAGCDGATSRVRDALRFPVDEAEGSTRYAIADCALVDVPTDIATLAVRGDRGVLVHPIAADRYRLAIDCGPTVAVGRPAPPLAEDLQRMCDAHLVTPLGVGVVLWSTYYAVGRRAATRWRARRVFLLGDAARVHSPITFHGMNAGIHDAWNLGWKVALAERGLATEVLLDSYDVERRDAQDRLVRASARADGVGSLRTGADVDELTRGFLTSLPGFERHAARRTARLDFGYRSSPAVDGYRAPGLHTEGPPVAAFGPGDLAPDAPFTTDAGVRVSDGRSYVSLQFTGDQPTDGQHTIADIPLPGRLPIRSVIVTRVPGVRSVRSGTSVVTDSGGGIHQAWGVTRPTHVLVRPDGHVGWRSEPPDLAAVNRFLARLHGPAAPDRFPESGAARRERLAG